MILSFADDEMELVFHGRVSRKLPSDIQRIAVRKLDYIDDATSLSDLSGLPGNRFEKLTGDRGGQFSIRINNQWRICFNWSHPNAENVEIVDYH